MILPAEQFVLMLKVLETFNLTVQYEKGQDQGGARLWTREKDKCVHLCTYLFLVPSDIRQII